MTLIRLRLDSLVLPSENIFRGIILKKICNELRSSGQVSEEL